MSERGQDLGTQRGEAEQQVLFGRASYDFQISRIEARFREGRKPYKKHRRSEPPSAQIQLFNDNQLDRLTWAWGVLILKKTRGQATEVTPMSVLSAVQQLFPLPTPEISPRLERLGRILIRDTVRNARTAA